MKGSGDIMRGSRRFQQSGARKKKRNIAKKRMRALQHSKRHGILLSATAYLPSATATYSSLKLMFFFAFAFVFFYL